jgi:feruloyl esterase
MKPTTSAPRDIGAAARLLATALIAHFASGLLPALGGAALATECRDLTGVTLAHVTVRSAEPINSGMFSADGTSRAPVAGYSDLPAFCRVRGLSMPVAGSEIGFELWLPQAKDWSRRLHMVGNGGYSSNIGRYSHRPGVGRAVS